MGPENKNIKKLMTLDPSLKTQEARQNFNPENFESNILGSPGEEKENTKNPGMFRKASIRILLLDILFTFGYILIINILGINLIFLFAGLLIAVLPLIFSWESQMKRYDDLAKQPFFEYSKKMKIIIIAIPFIFNFMILFLSNIIEQKLVEQAIFSFAIGFLVSLWLVYFQMRYWEKTNHKVIYIDKSYGIWKKSYIILERK
ncbi:MAG: DUF1673 family protein [Methanosarcina sp.]